MLYKNKLNKLEFFSNFFEIIKRLLMEQEIELPEACSIIIYSIIKLFYWNLQIFRKNYSYYQ